MFGWLKREKQAQDANAAALPAEVAAAIEGASVVFRPAGQDGEPRAVVQLPGLAGWMYGDEDAQRLRGAFPELNDAQLRRACRYLASRIAQAAASDKPQRRAGWVNNW